MKFPLFILNIMNDYLARKHFMQKIGMFTDEVLTETESKFDIKPIEAPLFGRMGVRTQIGATLSLLVKNSLYVNTLEKALEGKGIPVIEMDAKGMTLSFKNKDYGKDLHAFLQENEISGLEIEYGIFNLAVKYYNGTSVTHSCKAKIRINHHSSIRCLIEDICGYPQNDILVRLYAATGHQAIFQKNFPYYVCNSLKQRLTGDFFKIRSSGSDLQNVNFFIQNMINLGVCNGNYLEIRKGLVELYSHAYKKNLESENKELKYGVEIRNEDALQTTISCAEKYPCLEVALLNPANASIPGGAATRTTGTVEEAICRISDFLPQLILQHTEAKENYPFYKLIAELKHILSSTEWPKHIAKVINTEEAAKKLVPAYNIPTGTGHFNANIIFFKKRDSEVPTIEDIVLAHVISVAVPNLNPWHLNSEASKYGGRVFRNSQSKEIIASVIKENIRAVINIACSKKINILILTALGCGAFSHDPKMVAQCFLEVLSEKKYSAYIEKTKIIFSIFRSPETLAAFEQAFKSSSCQRELH